MCTVASLDGPFSDQPSEDCYYHEKFLQHRPQLAREIKRIAIKGTVGFISSSHCPQDDWGNTRPFALVPLVSDQPATSPVPTISADMPLTPKEAPQRQAEVTLALPCANGATNSSEGTTSRRDKSRWEAEPTLQSSLHELGCCREERDVLMLLLSLRHFETNQKVNQGPLPAR